MSLGKVARKLKRVGKSAFQFRFTSTFEYIDLSFNGSWRPDNLRVVWLRNHRKVKSTDVKWSPTEDRGPNGADGKAVFSPQISVALIVTLYKEGASLEFQEKEYKYYIENDGPNGKKILASFHCDMADYVGVPNSKHTLSMAFKPVSVKVSKASLGITLEAEFIKQGSAIDDDMQSTFSAISAGTEASAFDDDSEDELEEMSNGQTPRLAVVEETTEPGPGVPLDGSLKSVLMLGTGQELKRDTLPIEAPPKPSRGLSVRSHDTVVFNSVQADPSITADKKNEDLGQNLDSTIKPSAPDQQATTGNELKHISDEQSSTARQTGGDHLTPGDDHMISDGNNAPVKVEEQSKQEPDPGNGPTNGKQEPDPGNGPTNGKQEPDPGNGPTNGKQEPDPGNGPTNGKQEPDPGNGPTVSDANNTTVQESDKTNVKENIAESKQTDNPQQSPSESALEGVAFGGGVDDVFAAARSLAVLRKSSAPAEPRVEVKSQDEYQPPPNPYAVEPQEEEEETVSPTLSWVREGAGFVDCSSLPLDRTKLDSAEIIALYFSASWCPPCRRFLPKLVKFYHHVKQHGKSFEVLYISSDYSKTEMMKYMKDQQMPWVGLAYEGKVAESLQKIFSVSAIPQLKIVSTKGEMIEDSAKKPVELTNSGADVLRLYNKWYERLGTLSEDPPMPVKSKSARSPKRGTSESDLLTSPPADSGGKTRQAISNISRGRSTLQSKKKLRDSEEREEKIRHLEEVNMTLKQTNDDLNEELRELKAELNELREKVSEMEQTSRQLEADKQESIAKMNTMGWLYKKGVKGPTANFWRRRYFRCDQGPKICYYKRQGEGTPQGSIDLAKFISVQEVSPAQQDKNNATFLVQCDGRTYQLQAYDEATMRKWMAAIDFLAKWHKNSNLNSGASP